MKPPIIYLASQSPRRQQLLSQLGISFEIMNIFIDETIKNQEDPAIMVTRLAVEKAHQGFIQRSENIPVLGADTCVVLGDRILGKPKSSQDGINMLKSLSGRCHQVLTAVAVKAETFRGVKLSQSAVYFRDLSDYEIEAYWQTGEPEGKAGSYAIQGLGAIFVERIEGSYTGVMGLPLFETAQLLDKCNITLLKA